MNSGFNFVEMKKLIKRILFSIPPVKHVIEERDRYKTYHPPGHYYSPIPNKEEVKKDEKRIFDRSANEIGGIDLKENVQMELLESFLGFYSELPFPENKSDNYRYWMNNELYSYSDGIMLYCMIRQLKPAKLIEAGSGFSSAVTLDTNEKFLNNKMECTFIEPFPVQFNQLVKKFPVNYKLLSSRIQDVPLDEFRKLNANDILFIDSTHVSKTGSDVNYILFEILPILRQGVYIHFHDIFYPFEYPVEWVYKGFAWNECYLLKAFLQYNDHFEIILFNTFMEQFHQDWFTENMPLCLKNTGGSLWIRKNKQ